MVKLKNSDLISALMGLTSLSQRKLPVKMALRVVKAIKEVQQEWEVVEQVRQDLLDAHADRDEAGNKLVSEEPDGQQKVLIKEGSQEAFNRAWSELLNTEVEITNTLSGADLGETVEIEASVLLSLGTLLTE